MNLKTNTQINMESYEEKQKREKTEREYYLRRTAELKEIIKPITLSRQAADYDFGGFLKSLQRFSKDYGGLEMNPDFQRGHVWTSEQQLRFIENTLRGIVSASGFLVQFNCPNLEMADEKYKGDLPLGFQCIDGLQRITAIEKFLNGEIKPFGLTVEDLHCSAFSVKSLHYGFKMAVYNFQTRKQLLQHYLDFNAGGTPHSASEIERVKSLLEQ